MHDYLQKIIDDKKRELDVLDIDLMKSKKRLYPMKSFKNALGDGAPNVIAEIKRRSPSKGALASIDDPVLLAEQYVKGGASALSVLTNAAFSGSIDDLQHIAQALSNQKTAILQKEFILDERQLDQAVLMGADAILLIVAVLKEKTEELLCSAKKRQLDVLVEVHDQEELEYAIAINAEIIGVNNRNLHTFELNPLQALQLKPFIPNDKITVAESGIQSLDLARDYIRAGFDALLIGEMLVKSGQPKQLIEEIRKLR